MVLQERKMPELDWDDLRLFLAVARRGTLAAAAADLGVNASTVHRRVAALERALGARLFERDPRGYALTPVGEALVGPAEAAEDAAFAARRAATGHDRAARGAVRLTLPDTLLDVVVPHLATFCAAHPGIVVHLSTGTRLVDLGRETDVALRVSPDPPDEAVAHRVGTVAWAVYGPPGERPLPWVAYEGLDRLAAVRWWRAHHADAEVGWWVNEVGAMQRVLPCVSGVGLLPCYVGDRLAGVARRGPVIDEAATPLWLMAHVDLRRSARVRAVVDFLLPRLRAEAPRLTGDHLPVPG